MARIEITCPKCQKHTAVRHALKRKDGSGMNIYMCGHTEIVQTIASETLNESLAGIPSVLNAPILPLKPSQELIPVKPMMIWDREDCLTVETGAYKDLRAYQAFGVRFMERSNFNMVLGDEMGLGKTIQVCTILARNWLKLTPACIIVPPVVLYNWQRELMRWTIGRGQCEKIAFNAPMVHLNRGGNLLNGFNLHIISNAILTPELTDEIKAFGFKLLVVDESHQFKNDNSIRTQSLMRIAGSILHRILMSGTSIMNRTEEYFNSLHIVKPEQWPHKGLLRAYCAVDRQGKVLGLDNAKRDQFFYRTKDYVLRRLKADVLQDLPEKQVNQEMIPLTDNKLFVNQYNQQLDFLEAEINRQKHATRSMMQIIAIMAKLRHIVGMAKVPYTAIAAREFLENTDPTQKLVIGVHHKLVMSALNDLLGEFKPILMSDEPTIKKDSLEKTFRTDLDRRLGVISILGCGTGRNMQFVQNAIVMERQWNPAQEKQFEDRFHRMGQTEKVIIDYINAKDTIDEYFHDMIELKGNIAGSALDNDFETSNELMWQLAERTVNSRLKYVRAA